MINLTDYVHKIRERLKVSEVIGRDLKLSRKGHEFLGLCPFHQERTPSFTVNDNKAFYHCFGCGAHGDIISYKMQKNNLEFPVAVRELALESGIKIEEDKVVAKEATNELYGIINFCCEWFEDKLGQSSGEEARVYLEKRGISKDTQRYFRLGFSPSWGQNNKLLYQDLISRGFDKRLILESGVVSQNPDNGRIYDRFRSRIIFPILDIKGRVVAFGGRILNKNVADNNSPKYLNSAESSLFHKGELLYNYCNASAAVTKDNPPIVVEGYFDVISLHQAGWKTAMAPLGTALTEAQLTLLWRRHPQPLICFDGDRAGSNASLRAVERSLPLLRHNRSLRVCSLPGDEDPDSLLKNGGTSSLSRIFADSLSLADYLWRGMLKNTSPESLHSPEDKARFKLQVMELIKTIADPTIAHFYQQDFSQRLRQLWYDFSSIKNHKKARLNRSVSNLEMGLRRPVKKNDLGHQILLATLINHPILLQEVMEQFVGVNFQREIWNNLREFMVMYSEDDNLKERLENSKFSVIVRQILSQDVYFYAPFCLPGADQKEALARWQEIWRETTWKQQLKEDLRQAKATIRNSFNLEAWQQVKSLKQTLTPETIEI